MGGRGSCRALPQGSAGPSPSRTVSATAPASIAALIGDFTPVARRQRDRCGLRGVTDELDRPVAEQPVGARRVHAVEMIGLGVLVQGPGAGRAKQTGVDL